MSKWCHTRVIRNRTSLMIQLHTLQLDGANQPLAFVKGSMPHSTNYAFTFTSWLLDHEALSPAQTNIHTHTHAVYQRDSSQMLTKQTRPGWRHKGSCPFTLNAIGSNWRESLWWNLWGWTSAHISTVWVILSQSYLNMSIPSLMSHKKKIL